MLKNQLINDSSDDEPNAVEAKQVAINQELDQVSINDEQSASVSSQPSSADHVRINQPEHSDDMHPIEPEVK